MLTSDLPSVRWDPRHFVLTIIGLTASKGTKVGHYYLVRGFRVGGLHTY